MERSPSDSYSLTLRVKLSTRAGTLGEVATAIGKGFDFVLADEFYFLDFSNCPIGVVKGDLAVAFHHPHLDANAEVVSLSRAHVNGVALLVVGHVNDMFARLQFECEVVPVVHLRQLDIVNSNSSASAMNLSHVRPITEARGEIKLSAVD